MDAAARDRWVLRLVGTTGTYQSLPVRAGLARTRVAAAELPRGAGHLFAASGYQECEDQPLLELINSIADSAGSQLTRSAQESRMKPQTSWCALCQEGSHGPAGSSQLRSPSLASACSAPVG